MSYLSTLRESRQLTQAELAALVGISRQALSAIEAAKSSPNVLLALKLSKSLGCSVEDLFGEKTLQLTDNSFESPPSEGRVILASIGGETRCYPMTAYLSSQLSDGYLHRHNKQSQVEIHDTSNRWQERVIVAGCSPALGIICDALNQKFGWKQYLCIPCSSVRAIELLNAGRCHIAGVHHFNFDALDLHSSTSSFQLKERELIRISLGDWQLGVISQSTRSQYLKTQDGFLNPKIRWISRDSGSGAQALLDELRGKSSKSSRTTKNPSTSRRPPTKKPQISKKTEAFCTDQFQLASAIQSGFGDAGIASQDTALAFDLQFQAIKAEAYELLVKAEFIKDHFVARFFEKLAESGLKTELSRMGYDTANTASTLSPSMPAKSSRRKIQQHL